MNEKNEKNKDKKVSVKLNKLAHRRLKDISEKRGLKIEFMVDEAVWTYLKGAK